MIIKKLTTTGHIPSTPKQVELPGLSEDVHIAEIDDPQRFRQQLTEFRTIRGQKHRPCFFALGVAGVGKSYLIDKARDEITGINVGYVNIGDEMYAALLSKYPRLERDEIRNLSVKEQDETRAHVMEDIARMSMRQLTIIDTHATIETPDGYMPGMTPEMFRQLLPCGIILIEDSEEAIQARRVKDNESGKRYRNPDPENIRRHQRINREVVNLIAAASNTPVIHIIRTGDITKDTKLVNAEMLRNLPIIQ